MHSIGPLIIFISSHMLLVNRFSYTNDKSRLISLVVALSLILLWELYEYSSDLIFHTKMVLGSKDTIRDLIYGTGAIITGFLMTYLPII